MKAPGGGGGVGPSQSGAPGGGGVPKILLERGDNPEMGGIHVEMGFATFLLL